MRLRERIDGYEREVTFWCFVAVSTALYVAGGKTLPVGGWILRKAVNVLKFWIEIVSVVVF